MKKSPSTPTSRREWAGLQRLWRKATLPSDRQTKSKPTASAFANWVFDQTVTRNELPVTEQALQHSTWKKRLELGTVTHQDIELFRMHCWTQSKLKHLAQSEWALYFADKKARPDRPFLASRLTVAGQPMRCIPDVVLHHRAENTFIIVERKTTTVPKPFIPSHGWPNVEAQLWCYSWIDEFKNASRVVLVSQIWQRIRGGLSLCHEHAYWQRRDYAHEQRCELWFGRYGGMVHYPRSKH